MSLYKISDMKSNNQESKNTIGNKGERFVIDKLKTAGYQVYKKNLKKIDAEIDIVAYRYDPVKYKLDIRVIEVKTRNKYEFDLLNFDISNKWRHIRKYMFNIKSEIDHLYDVLYFSEVHFDLALVKYNGDSFNLYSYIKDVNLML